MIATVLLLLCAAPQEGDAEARALLAKAEESASKGRYRDARDAYEKLAERHPATEAGKVGARRSKPSAFLGWKRIVDNGPPSNRVDVVLMGDGYELGHLDAFDELAEDVPPLFERVEPFREYWSYFNFVRASLVSADSGVDGFGREYDTALNARTASTFAGHVALDAERVRAMLDELPEHDGLAVCFVKNGVAGTGGGGFAAIGGRDAGTTIHEFGHAFGELGDEYDVQQSAHRGRVGSAPNVSAVEDPERVPWAHWIRARHPSVGVHKGAAGRLDGAWKPTSAGCVMASEERFCVVCREALVLRIYSIVDPIESCSPMPQTAGTAEPYRIVAEPLVLSVTTMRPESHRLEVRWWLLPGVAPSAAPGGTSRSDPAGRRRVADRTERGPLPPIEAKPHRVSANVADGVHRLSLSREDLEPGTYRVVARARDTTELRGERFPWVLADPDGLLESERTWWVRVMETAR